MSDDLHESAARRYKCILDAHPELLDIPGRAERILSENTRFSTKSVRLYQLADKMRSMLEHFVVCGVGCSYCCHMPTMIYQHEADMMAAAGNCNAKELGYRPAPLALRSAMAFNGQPCSFLADGRCSIYEHRPLICRLHNSLNDNPHDCLVTTGGKRKSIYAVNPDYVEMPYHRAVLKWKPREPWGAIQEFFPLGSVLSPK